MPIGGSRMCLHSYYTHRDTQQHTKDVKYYYCVGYINLKCLHVIMDLQCMYQNKAIYLLTHKQLHFLCESTVARTQLALKGNGRWDSDWFIAHYAQNTSITKRIGTTLFVPCAGLRDHFSHRWTSESGFGHALSTPAPCALDHALRSLN